MKLFRFKGLTKFIIKWQHMMVWSEPRFFTLLVSVATVALMLLADNNVIFSLAKPKKDTRG